MINSNPIAHDLEGSQQGVEKGGVILNIVIEIGFPSDAWRALAKMTAETIDKATYRVKEDLEA